LIGVLNVFMLISFLCFSILINWPLELIWAL
jgi:hypothetical protein